MSSLAGIVYTGQQGGRGDNSGGAAVLNNNSAQLGQQQRAADMQEALLKSRQLAAEAKLAKEQQKSQQKALNTIEPKIDGGYLEADNAQLNDMLNVYHNDMSKVMAEQGERFDDPTSQNYRDATGESKYIEDVAEKMKQNADFLAKAKATLDGDKGKYNKEYAAEWFEKFQDPNISYKKRNEMILDPENSPFKVNFNKVELLKTLTEGGKTENGSITQHSPEKVELIYNSLASTPDGLETLEAAKEGDETPEETKQRLIKEAMIFGGKSLDEPKSIASARSKGTTDYAASASNGMWGDKNQLTVVYKKDPNSPMEEISVKDNTRDLPQISATIGDTTYAFSLEKFFTKDGKTYAFGQAYEKGGDGKWSNVSEGKSILWDDIKGQIGSQLYGFDPDLYLSQVNRQGKTEGTQSNQSDKGGQKTYTMTIDGYTKKGLTKEQMDAKKAQFPNATVKEE